MNDVRSTSPAHARLIRKLESIAVLGDEDRRGIADLPLDVRTLAENADISSEGDSPVHCCLLIEGFACRYKVLGEGQRQIMSFHLAGDIPDLQTLHLKVMDHSVGTLTPVLAGFIPHAPLHALIRRRPAVGGALWKDTLIEAAVFREWLVGSGRRSAHARIAHLICEQFVRMRAVGLVEDHSFELPVTQAELADSLGLSAVHVNRVLQDLRRDGLIANRGRTFLLTDWAGLQRVAQFDPTYLHLERAVP